MATTTTPSGRAAFDVRDGPVAAAVAAVGTPAPRTVPPPRLATDGRNVVALRRGGVIEAGAILDRGTVQGANLVAATGADGVSWWIPAEAVWTDGEAAASPQHPRPVGLATAADETAACVQGLSDRLGWEAVMHLERGGELPVLARPPDPRPFVVFDGRLGHALPTVVVMTADVTRWGAATTWDRALHRALYGARSMPGAPDELAAMCSVLAQRGLRPVTVDLGTPRLRQLGVTRCSVQLLAA